MKDKNMSGIYISIDAGTFKSGYIVIDNSWCNMRIKEFGIINNKDIFRLLERYSINKAVVVLEMINSTKQRIGATTIETIFVIGRFYDRAKTLGCEPILLKRRTIKKILCPGIRARDKHVRAAVIKLFGEPGTKKNPGNTYGITSHVWQALGALTAYFIKEGIKIKI